MRQLYTPLGFSRYTWKAAILSQRYTVVFSALSILEIVALAVGPSAVL
jgi:hypothetical protein